MASTSEQLLVMSVLQWNLFLGLGFLIFGWTEKRRKLSMIGYGVFIAGALFSAYTLTGGVALNEEVVRDQRLITLSWGALLLGLLSVPALVAKWKEWNWRPLNIVILALSLLLFVLLTQRSYIQSDEAADSVKKEQAGKE